MSRNQKVFRLYDLDEYKRNEDAVAVSATYAKDKRGALKTFEQGTHQGCFMLVWENGEQEIIL